MQRKSNAVVFLAMTYPTGGIRHFALLGNALHKINDRNFDLYVASINREADQGFWNTVCSEVPERDVIRAATFSELVGQILKLAEFYDHVIIHTGGGWGQTKYFVRTLWHLKRSLRKRISLIGTTHSYRNGTWLRIPMSVFQYVLYRLFYRKIIFQCQYAVERFAGGDDLIRRGMGVVVPLGCEVFPTRSDVIPPTVAKIGLDKILLDEKRFKFVYLAAFRPGKMHTWLVHAIAPVLRNHREVMVLLCGTGEQDVIQDAKTAVVQEGLQDQILFPGRVPRDVVPWLLQHSDCALVPSRSETFGHNFLEPMFAGIPVIGTSVGIGRDVIIEDRTGKFFDLSDPLTLEKAAEWMIRRPFEVARMGQKAKATVETRFRHVDVALQLVELYKRVLE